MAEQPELTPEQWNAQWEQYFDELDQAIERIDVLGEKAEDAGLESVAHDLVEAADAIMQITHKLALFLDTSQTKMIGDIYKQNPLLRMMLEQVATGVKK